MSPELEYLRDAERFVHPAITGFLDVRRLPHGVAPIYRKKWSAEIRKTCPDFIVTEPIPAYPGMPDWMADAVRRRKAFLTLGTDSDMPELRTDEEMYVTWRERKEPAVAMTVAKMGVNTWSVCDKIAKHISACVGREIHHSRVLTSGLKDRRAWTVQTVVVVGVSMEEMRTVRWDCFFADGKGFTVKDVRPTDRLIKRGQHAFNGFVIRVKVEGRSAEELTEYLRLHANLLRHNNHQMVDGYGRQRLGPFQDMYHNGEALLTGRYVTGDGLNHPEWDLFRRVPPTNEGGRVAGASLRFSTNVETMLHRLVCESSARDSKASREVRGRMRALWGEYFQKAEDVLFRAQQRGVNMSLEYEIVSRYADLERFNGCAESILYDLRDRLSLCVGAIQGRLINESIASVIAQIPENGLANEAHRQTKIPFLMSCAQSKEFYSRTETGRAALAMLETTEELAAPAEEYFRQFVRVYWEQVDAERRVLEEQRQQLESIKARLSSVATVAAKAGVEQADAELRKLDRQFEALDAPDSDTGLSLQLVNRMFNHFSAKPAAITVDKPRRECLSAALVKYMLLTPRDQETGLEKDSPPARTPFVGVRSFSFKCDDEVAELRFSLPNGRYATIFISQLFDLSDKQRGELVDLGLDE